MRSKSARVDSSASMARESATAVQITIRIPKDMLALADEVAELLSRPGLPASRNDALRAAVARGLAVLKDEAKGAEPSTKKRR